MKPTASLTPALKISVASIAANVLLTIIKLLAGLIGHSSALVADAIHSASDVLSTCIVIVGLVIARREADEDHEYGHGKFESLAALFLSLALLGTGLKIGYDAIVCIWTKAYLTIALPKLLTVAAAILSILVKEGMFQITYKVGKQEKSNALIADAWHHRSDALSSIGSMIGILFARFGFPIMDSVASLIICILIIKTAYDIMMDSIRNLTDASCDKATENSISDLALSTDGVCSIDLIRTRRFGSGYYVDMEISLRGDLTLETAHRIAEAVHDAIEEHFPEVHHCMIHVNPAE